MESDRQAIESITLATDQHRAGNLPHARKLYQQVLEASPGNVVARFRLGILEMQLGNFATALPLMQQAADTCPEESKYQIGLGELFTAMQRWEEAAVAYRRAGHLDRQSADAQFGLGNALRSKGDYSGAINAYQTAVKIQPDFADAHNNLGNCFKVSGDFAKAETAYRNALRANPQYAGAMSNLGIVLQAQGKIDQAIESLHAATVLMPDSITYAVNLGAALCGQRNFPQAQSVLDAAVKRDPDHPEALYNLANAMHESGQLREAVEYYHRVIAIDPDHVSALINLGNVYKELGDYKQSAAAYGSALRVKPDSIIAINNMGVLLRTMGKLDGAEATIRRGLELNPDHSTLHDNLGNVLKDAGHLGEAIQCFRRASELDPTAAVTHSNLAYALSFQSAQAQPILQECLRFNAQHTQPLQVKITGHGNDRLLQKRLRIGYVSPDFREHCQSLFTVALLANHDHLNFEIYCYSSVERPDGRTRQIAGYADVWREVRSLDDAALAELIRRDQIDILVDLTMHMASGRPLLFARKPAPVQAAWLAYPGTTGLSAMDYRFSDPRLDPPENQSHYTEKTIYLPDSFWCYDPLTDQPEVNQLPALSTGRFTLGCLNNPCKLTDQTLQLWGKVMSALPGACLLLLAPAGTYQQDLIRRLEAHHIAADRVDFVQYQPRDQYLKSYQQIDLGIDTFPYNGHTTSLDSFWMGVPVVSRVGETCVGRGGLSQLFQLNLMELGAESDAAFVAAVVDLANDLPKLAKLRQQLRSRLENSALMNAKRFARNMESAFGKMWKRYCEAPSADAGV